MGTMSGTRIQYASIKQLMLARPRDRRIEEAGDSDPAWRSAFDSGLDESWCEEGHRYRHINVTLAASLPCGNAVD
jgi:hypothetical protein